VDVPILVILLTQDHRDFVPTKQRHQVFVNAIARMIAKLQISAMQVASALKKQIDQMEHRAILFLMANV